ncbi:multiprotein-bridging factor 1 family protein [Chitinophaga sp. YR627]|uniref:helix-turn-helix domain-containing protein n=1 Tax=Chitinophaga sp. YR627 TaxID=1881041 RepID=UPI002100BDA1|nr:helix-turn-helix transcriptional regulator [Chitinophaga sp. YR627]
MNKITYYSFHIDGDDLCEVEKFVTTFNEPAYGEDYHNIMSVIREMGMNRGAEAKYFRHEKAAEALPPPYTSGDVRLYCSRITRDIVILGNGCVKITQKVQQSKDCLFHFELVNALSTQITQRIVSGDLKIVNKQFEGNYILKLEIVMSKIFEDAMNAVPAYGQERAAMSLDVVDRIEAILEMKGMSHRELAAALGKSESEISKWMRGTHNFTFDTIAKINLALGVKVIEIPKSGRKRTVMGRLHPDNAVVVPLSSIAPKRDIQEVKVSNPLYKIPEGQMLSLPFVLKKY